MSRTPRRAAPTTVRPASRTPLRSALARRGRAFLIVGGIFIVAAYAFSRSEFLYAGSLLLGLPLLAVALVRFRQHRMAVNRRFSPAVAEAGNSVTVFAQIRNLAGHRTSEASWRDTWQWAPFSTEPARLRSISRNRGAADTANQVDINYVLTPPRRGVFDVGPLVVDVADPFQLVRGEVVVGETQKLVVTPRVAVLPFTGLSVAADDGSARALQRRNSGGGDDLMTREYRDGDPMRRVHWKATARHGELMVRLEEQRSRAQAHIVLETRRSGYRDTGLISVEHPESDSFEWAVAFAASLALHLQHSGFTVDVTETGYRQVASPEHPEEFLESLAAIGLVGGAHLPRLLANFAEPGRSRGSLFAIIADAEAPTIERLVSQRGQFDSALAIVVNPHNEVVIQSLRHAGWACVAARPTDDIVAVWIAAAEVQEASRA